MRLLSSRLFAAAAGVLVLAGFSSAQSPGVVPAGGKIPPVVAQPAPGPTLPTIPVPPPAAQPSPVSIGAPAGPGCTNCGTGGTAHRGFVMGNAAGPTGYFTTDCPSGRSCNNGCGSFKGDAGFVFGSCRSFFSPCNPGTLGCHGGCHGGKCGPMPIYGRGPCGPFNPCFYDSYLNH